VRGPSSTGDPVRRRPTAEAVEAPVRIADAATVRLLRPGDRVDVIAAEETAAGGEARVVARKALVTRVPEPLDGGLGGLGASAPDGTADVTGEADTAGGVEVAGGFDVAGEAGLPGGVDGGALVVLSVPPSTAARLAGASATARLAVTLW
jgi:hypothetical protein